MNSLARQLPRTTTDSAVLDDLLEQIANELHAGHTVDAEAFIQAHPDHAEDLRRLLPAMLVMADLQRSLAGSAPGEPLATFPPCAAGAEGVAGTLGDFQLHREIGRGGMGVVYEATQLSLNRRVALKVLPFASTLDSRQLQRFKNEAQAAACLHHTNIVPVFATGVERGVHFYAMQFIEGHSLAEVIAAFGDRPSAICQMQEEGVTGAAKVDSRAETARAALQSTMASLWPNADSRKPSAAFYRTVAELGIQAAEALEYAHQMGIVHRDIKPGNLMLSEGVRALERESAGAPTLSRSHTPTLWVMDFGLAQFQTDTKLTMTGDLLGTLRYMSPEQALAKRVIVDHRTDIYSLGATLYELLTQQPAVPGEDKQEVLRRIAFEDPKPPRKINKAIPAELETIVLKAMEKRPEERYATAGDVARDLRCWLEEKSIRAKRPGLILKARKWGRRHKPLVGAAIAVLLVAVVGLAASAVLVLQHNRELEEKNKHLAAAAAAEKEAKETALAREADTKAFSDFLVDDMLAVARPEGVQGGLGVGVTVAQALEAAEAKLEERFAGRPLAEAMARDAIGVTWRNLSKYEQAERHLRRAVELREQELGPDDAMTLSSHTGLGLLLHNMGRDAEAIEIHEGTLKRQAKHGPDHAETLACMNNLAMAYQTAGKFDLALPLFEQLLQKGRAILGPDHPHTLIAMQNLASAYEATNKLNLALSLYQENLEQRKKKLGPDHPHTLFSMNGLAMTHQAMGKLDLALSLFEQAFAKMQAKLGPDHHDTLACMHNLAFCYAKFGQHEKAELLFRELARIWKEKAGAASPKYAQQLASLGMILLEQQKPADAEPLLRESLAIREKTQPDAWGKFNTKSLLGGSLLGQKNYAEAEPLLLAGYEGMKQREEKIPPQGKVRLTEALERLVQLYDVWGQMDKADEWRQKLEATKEPAGKE